MGRKGFGKKKDRFADLPQSFTEAVLGMNREELRQRLATITLNHVELLEFKKNDQDLKDALETAKAAGATYRDGAKQFKLQSEFIKKTIDDKGGDTSKDAQTVDADKEAAKIAKEGFQKMAKNLTPGSSIEISVPRTGAKATFSKDADGNISAS